MKRLHSRCLIARRDWFDHLCVESGYIVHLVESQEVEKAVKIFDAVLPIVVVMLSEIKQGRAI